MPVPFRQRQDLAAGFAVGQGARRVRFAGREQDRRFPRRLYELSAQRRAQMRVAHDAHGVPSAGNTAGEQRVVAEHRPDPYQHGGKAVPVLVDAPARGLARDPFRCARRTGGLAVHRHRVLKDTKRRARADEVEKHGVFRVAFCLQDALGHLDARRAQQLDAPARHERVRVAGADDDPRNAAL